MDEIEGAVKTVTMMSPPALVIAGAMVMNFILKPFLPEKYLWPIATIGGGAVSPYMFPPETIIYPVPSPTTALVIVGGIMGFVGSVFHRRLDRWPWLRNKLGINGHDTKFFTRTASTAPASDKTEPPTP